MPTTRTGALPVAQPIFHRRYGSPDVSGRRPDASGGRMAAQPPANDHQRFDGNKPGLHFHLASLSRSRTAAPCAGKSCRWRTYEPWRRLDLVSHAGQRPPSFMVADTAQPPSPRSACEILMPRPGAHSVFVLMRYQALSAPICKSIVNDAGAFTHFETDPHNGGLPHFV